MQRTRLNMLDWLAVGLGVLFVLDRLLKLAAVVHFFRGLAPPDPPEWPSITLFQPITRGVSGLSTSLRSRARLDYPATIQHLLICDAHDAESQAECRALLVEFPTLHGEIILVEANDSVVASKTEKLLAAIPHATGDVF